MTSTLDRREAVPRILKAYGVLIALAFCGYTIVGKSFAYLGVPPVYVAELLIFTGLLLAVTTPIGVRFYFGDGVATTTFWIIHAFMIWGVVCTVPYVSQYGLDAFRDSVLCEYAVVAVLLCVVARSLGGTGGVLRRYVSYARFYPQAVTIMLVLSIGLVAGEAVLTGDGELPLAVKPGDFAVHLAGVTVAVLVGLVPEAGLGLTWLLGVGCGLVFVAAQNRGGMFSYLAAVALACVLRRRVPGRISGLAPKILVMVLLLAPALGAVGEIRGREVSLRQMTANVASCLPFVEDPDEQAVLAGPRTWRLLWWSRIVDYTLHGDYFWSGKGFGVNLADADGFQVGSGSLRSPHNSHVCLLGRTGVPGFVLWTLLQGSWALSLLRAYLRSRRLERDEWTRVFAFLLCYWLAFVVNASFDVFFEGPMGAIPFWLLIGLGMVAVREYSEEESAILLQREVRAA